MPQGPEEIGHSRCRLLSVGELLVTPHPPLPGFKPLWCVAPRKRRVAPRREGDGLCVCRGGVGLPRGECLAARGTHCGPEAPLLPYKTF